LNPDYSNILVRVPNWLGDSFMATPAVSAVREMFPKAKLSILAKPGFADFWKAFPGVDEVLVLDRKGRHRGLFGFWNLARELKKQNFDASLILPLSFSSAFLFFLAEIPERIGYGAEGRDLFLTESIEYEKPRQRHLVWEYLRLVQKGFGGKLARKTFGLESATKPGDTEAAALIRKHKIADRKGLIALGPGATYGPAKRWPLPYWKDLIEKILDERPESLLVLGGKEEKDYLQELMDGFAGSGEAKRIHLLTGETSVLGLASLLSRCKVLVTNDTGPMHVAAAVKTPTVAVFGSTSPLWTRPFGLGHQVITHSVECSPCFQKTCPIGYICLHQITVGEVWKAVQKTLKAKTTVKAELILQGALA